MALGLSVANDIANAILKHYTRGPALYQTNQDKPLLRFLGAGKKTFPGGNQYVSDAVKGTVMNDTAGFFAGYAEDEQLVFKQAQNILRAEYAWKECHAGLIITWTELKKDGIVINDHNEKSENSGIEADRLTSLLEDRMEDFGESWSRAVNNMLWRDGTQDSEQVPGVLSVMDTGPTVGTVGGLARNTYTFWRQGYFPGIVPSEANQTLTKTLRTKQRVLRRYGGRPNKFLCGSTFLDELEGELQAKGFYTDSGFANEGKNDVGMADIRMRGVGSFEYDPTLDDLNLQKSCFEFDSRRIKLRPMAGEENKVLTPERPYDYMVFIKSMTWTGALSFTQLNCHGRFDLA